MAVLITTQPAPWCPLCEGTGDYYGGRSDADAGRPCYCTERGTLVVNFFGGPGCGKSTTSLGLAHELKLREIEVEYAHEWIKHLVWRKQKPLPRSYYVWAKQQALIDGLIGAVDVVVTDSPTPLAVVYSREYGQQNDSFEQFVWDKFHAIPRNFNFYIERDKNYHPMGRLQTEEQARDVDTKVHDLLHDVKLQHEHIEYQEDLKKTLADWVIDML